MKLFSYVVRWDHGFAPNPFHGVCSLATCKPGIRNTAAIGDWVLGTGPSRRHYQDKAIFLMKVTEITTFNGYWHDPRFLAKRPVLNGSFKVRFGDNIYHRSANGAWIQEDSRHSQLNAVENAKNLKRDTGLTDKVLLSTEFIYWGDQAPTIPPAFAAFHTGRPSYQYNYPPAAVQAFLAWAQSSGKSGRIGTPLEWNWAKYWR
jgi:hypothetical protein